MNYIPRHIDSALAEWARSESHKPLLLRGARQVGKSSAIRNMAQMFDYCIEVNFEKQSNIKTIFDSIQDVHELVNRLGIIYNTPIVAGKTLLFLDEIQACESAIKSLWAFKEDFPDLHVIAAGSLLEFSLHRLSSFGVGRIRSLFMYPMSFDEFLMANNKPAWVEAKQHADEQTPLFETLHQELVQQFRTFMIVGGMPAVVATWTRTHNYQTCVEELEDIQQTYYDDFVKYGDKINPTLLRNTLNSVVMQIGHKFVYNRVVGDYRSNEVKQALAMLQDAGLIKCVHHSSGNGIPLGAEVNDKFNKYIYLDSGLLLRILDLDLGGSADWVEMILSGRVEDIVNKGSLTEMIAGWELLKYGSNKVQNDLYYWENLANGTTSEVDYLLTLNGKVVPWEVKAGTSGKMKSLRVFMNKSGHSLAVRSSLENFAHLNVPKDDGSLYYVKILPLYALSNLFNR